MGDKDETAERKKINIDYFDAFISDYDMVYVTVFNYSRSYGGQCVRKFYCFCFHAGWVGFVRQIILWLDMSDGGITGVFIFCK